MQRKTKHLYDFDKFRLDAERGRLTREEEIVPLPPKAFELLLLLVERQGRVVEKDFLMTALWQETFVEESNLTQNIYLLRKALGKTAAGEPFIETQSKRGYKFAPEVNLIEADESAIVVSKTTNIRARITEEIEDEKILPSVFRRLFFDAQTNRLKTELKFSAALGAVLVGGALFYFIFAAPGRSSAPIKSIAVMPFKTVGASETDNFWGSGMADAIITRLGKTTKINVSSIDAARRYDERGTNAVDTARALGAEAVLTGSVQRDGERTRVTVQLVRAADGQTLWTDSFDEQSADVFALQDRLSQRLAGALAVRLSNDEQRRLTEPPTENLAAYDLYLQGRFLIAKRTTETVQKAIYCFEEAARLDPAFAEAFAGIADGYALTASGLPPRERFPKAKAAAQRALELDETLAAAHTSLAFILYKSEWNWREAETHFRRAVEINPNAAQAHHWFGEMLGLRGRFDEGLNYLQTAERLDPLSLPIKNDTAMLLYRARRYDEAIEQARKALALDPNFRNAYNALTRCYQQKEAFPEAIKADLESLRLSNYPPEKIEELRKTFAASGWQAYWRKQGEIQQAQNMVEYVPTYQFIEIQLRLGETQQALESLEKAFDERGDAPLYVFSEPPLDVLRADPRFQSLVRRAER